MDITTSYSSGRLVLHLSGELDHHGARGAMDRIEGYLEKYMPRDAVLDLAGLTRAQVENPASQPLRVLDASGIDRFITVKGERRK